jgi:hypothetical protein
MARSVRYLTETAALLADRGIDLVVLKQGIDTTTRPAGSPSTCSPRWTRCSPTSSLKAPARAWNPSGPAAGSAAAKPKLTTRQAEVARGMYDETGADDRPATKCGKVISALSRISGKPGDTDLGKPADRKRAAGDVRAGPGLYTNRCGHGFRGCFTLPPDRSWPSGS